MSKGENSINRKKRINIAVIGAQCIGKTSLLERLQSNDFNISNVRATIGWDLVEVKNDNEELVFWDTSSKSEFDTLLSASLKAAESTLCLIMVNADLTKNEMRKELEGQITRIQGKVHPACRVGVIGLRREANIKEVNDELANICQDQTVESKAKKGQASHEKIAVDYLGVASVNENNFYKSSLNDQVGFNSVLGSLKTVIAQRLKQPVNPVETRNTEASGQEQAIVKKPKSVISTSSSFFPKISTVAIAIGISASMFITAGRIAPIFVLAGCMRFASKKVSSKRRSMAKIG